MPTETRTIERRIEEAVKTLFPTTHTIDSIAVVMHINGNNSVEKNALFCDVVCRELAIVPGHESLKDYSAIIELAAISQIVEDADEINCDKLAKILQDFLISSVTKSALSTGSGLTIDAVIFDRADKANNPDYAIKTCSAKIYMQNAI